MFRSLASLELRMWPCGSMISRESPKQSCKLMALGRQPGMKRRVEVDVESAWGGRVPEE